MKIKVRSIEDNIITEWELTELINRINEDNATDLYDYDENDWEDGFKETLEGEFYSLFDENGTALNLINS